MGDASGAHLALHEAKAIAERFKHSAESELATAVSHLKATVTQNDSASR